jgi:hypothetical protein
LRRHPIGDLVLAIKMPGAEFWLPATELVGRVEIGPNEVLGSGLGGDLEHADSPVDFGFFANGKAIGVDESEVDVLKDGVEGCLVVSIAFNDADAWEGCQLKGCGGGGGPG